MTPQALLEHVVTLAGSIWRPATLTVPQLKRALIGRCVQAGLTISTREFVEHRTPGSTYRGKLGLVIMHPGNPSASIPAAYVAVEFAKGAIRARSSHKLKQVPKHLPVCTLILCTETPSNVDSMSESVDRVVILGS